MKNITLPVCIILAVFLAACGAGNLQPTSTNSAKVTPTHTITPSPTILPATATPIPSATLSPFPTLPILPTLEPATPERNPSAYHLATETADQANENLVRIEQAILDLENAPVPENAPGYMPNYGSYYRAAWYASWDALAHFPNDPRAKLWQWKIPYYMTLAGDGDDAAQIYGNKISTALNSGETTANNLEDWFQSGELEDTIYTQSYILKKHPFKLKDSSEGYLVELGRLDDIDTPGGMCLLVVRKTNQYTSYLVYNGFQDSYNIITRNPITCSLKDLTGDGTDEIIVNRYRGGHYGNTTIEIFGVTSLPPKIVPFEDGQNLDIWNGDIKDYPDKNGKVQIQVYRPIGDLNCDNYYDDFYQWNGKWFELVEQNLHFGTSFDASSSTFCIDTTLLGRDTPSFLDQIVQNYRPQANSLGDIFHELVIREAIAYALSDDSEKARSILTEMIKAPIIENSIWIEPAKKFLETYKRPSDIYRACSMLTACAPYRENGNNACSDTALCYTSNALSYLLNTELTTIPLTEITSKLKMDGVKIAAEGFYDFDQDQKRELWFTFFNKQSNDLELWVGSESSKGNSFFNLGYYEPNIARPTFLIIKTPLHPFVLKLAEDQIIEIVHESGNDTLSFKWLTKDELTKKSGTSEKDILVELKQFIDLRQQFLTNGNANSIYRQLVLLNQKDKRCAFEIVRFDGTERYYYDCAAFYYTLALSAELAKKLEEAAALYHKIWAEYPYSAFSILARLKLQK